MAISTNTPKDARSFADDWVVDYIAEEKDKLHSLAMCLTHELEPDDPNDGEDHPELHAWRLALMMEERLESTRFVDNIRTMLMQGTAQNCSMIAPARPAPTQACESHGDQGLALKAQSAGHLAENRIEVASAVHDACRHLNFALDRFYDSDLAALLPFIAPIELQIQNALKELQRIALVTTQPAHTQASSHRQGSLTP